MGFTGFADEPAGWSPTAGNGIGLNNTESWELKGKRTSR
jgi:hypothetical protein